MKRLSAATVTSDPEPSALRVGWSVDGSSLQLGKKKKGNTKKRVGFFKCVFIVSWKSHLAEDAENLYSEMFISAACHFF